MMTLSPSPPAVSQTVDRPSGVWLLSLLNGIFWGLLPILDTAASHYWQPDLLISLPVETLITSIALPALIAVAAFGAWKGNRLSRVSLVALLALDVGAVAFNTVVAAAAYIAPRPWTSHSAWTVSLIVLNGSRPFLWAGINAWYFLGQRPHAFYTIDRSQMPEHSVRNALATLPAWLWGSIGGVLVFSIIFLVLYLLQPKEYSGLDLCKQLDVVYVSFWLLSFPGTLSLLFSGRLATSGISQYIFAALPLAFVGGMIPTVKHKRYGVAILGFIIIVLILYYLYGLFLIGFAIAYGCVG